MSAPRFTVLIPTHNKAELLRYAIQSVLAQTETNFELMIVMDGCTDSTKEVIEQFHDERIRVFDLPKAPHFGYANRNIALKEAKGKFIAYVSHDNIVFPDHLERMGELMEKEGSSWGYSRPLWVSADGVIVPFMNNLTLQDELNHFLERYNTIPATCVVHTREALQQAGFWPENVPSAADWALWKIMLRREGCKLSYLRIPTALHFSADWHHSRHSGMREVQTLLSIADKAEWWPDALYTKQDRQDSTEQAKVWESMAKDPYNWVSAVRQAVIDLSDRIAWDYICTKISEQEVLELENQALKCSKSWRFTSPFRKIGSLIRNLSI